jgi:DNA helicase-2/ATP-dependent DNA helicase PcrA
LEPNKDTNAFKQVSFQIADFEVEIVENQLRECYEKIMAHDFTKGCDEKDCQWCEFVDEQ